MADVPGRGGPGRREGEDANEFGFGVWWEEEVLRWGGRAEEGWRRGGDDEDRCEVWDL